MKQAIIVHGKPSKQSYFNPNLPSASNSIWLPWLQQQLLICGIDTQTPEMPESWRPDYPLWRQTFEKYDVNSETILVGHSCGGGFLIQWMSENPQICAGDVYLVAPAFGTIIARCLASCQVTAATAYTKSCYGLFQTIHRFAYYNIIHCIFVKFISWLVLC